MSNTIQFKDYIFNCNPKTLQIKSARNLVEIKLPLIGSTVQDMGISKRIITGQGEFIGSDCIQKAQKLELFSQSSESGLLLIPNFEPINAILHSITLNLDNLPQSVSYKFEFWECPEYYQNNAQTYTKKYHIALYGETLWSISRDYNTSVERLLKANPDIKRPDMVCVGQKVVIV